MFKNGIVFALCGVIVAGCTPSSTTGVVRSRANSSGPFGMFSPDAVTVATPAAFKGLGKVVVGSFIVGFSTYDTASASSGAYGNAAKNTLVGVDSTVMQRVVDTAYADLIANLKAQGYTVVDRAELAANPGFAATKSYPNPYEDSSGGLFGNRSKISYVSPSGFGGTRIYQGDIAMTLGGFGMDNPGVATGNYAEATGTRVIHAVYVLGFVNAASGMRLTKMVEVGQGITAKPNVTKLGIIGRTGGVFASENGTVTLGQPITSDREFATIGKTTTDGAVAAEVAVNVLTSLMGAGSSTARDFAFTARPADYIAAATDALNQVNAVFIAKMVSLR